MGRVSEYVVYGIFNKTVWKKTVASRTKCSPVFSPPSTSPSFLLSYNSMEAIFLSAGMLLSCLNLDAVWIRSRRTVALFVLFERAQARSRAPCSPPSLWIKSKTLDQVHLTPWHTLLRQKHVPRPRRCGRRGASRAAIYRRRRAQKLFHPPRRRAMHRGAP